MNRWMTWKTKQWAALLLAGICMAASGCTAAEPAGQGTDTAVTEAGSADNTGSAAGTEAQNVMQEDPAGQGSLAADGSSAGSAAGNSVSAEAGAAGENMSTEDEAAAESASSLPEGALVAEAISPEEQVKTIQVSLGFAGDICFGDNYSPMQYLAALGSEDIADGIDRAYLDLMQRMDLMWINNEFVYTDYGEPLPGKMYTFWGSPEHVNYLHDMGVDIVGLANNHTFDTGIDGFRDTLETLENAGIPYVGAGWDLEQAMEPVLMEAGDVTIAYVAASCAEYPGLIYTMEATETEPGILWCYDDAHILEVIQKARERADFVVVLPHWGDEHTTILQEKQTSSARAYIDAGADIVIGAHPHILQGLEYYNGKPILYSLGNFWFDEYDIDTVVAEVQLTWQGKPGEEPDMADTDVQVILHPGTQTGMHTYFADTEDWRERIFGQLEAISPGIEIDENGIVHAADTGLDG